MQQAAKSALVGPLLPWPGQSLRLGDRLGKLALLIHYVVHQEQLYVTAELDVSAKCC